MNNNGLTQFCAACEAGKHRCSRRLMTPEEQHVVTKARMLINYARTGGKENFKDLPVHHDALARAVDELDLTVGKEPH